MKFLWWRSKPDTGETGKPEDHPKKSPGSRIEIVQPEYSCEYEIEYDSQDSPSRL